LRTTGPLANQDPLSSCVEDPNVCKGVYGDYVQLDLGKGIKDGLDLGGNGGDQEYITGEAGPANDRRQAVWSAQGDGTAPFDSYLNFQILDSKLGPTSQDPAQLAVCVTYYDDPELAGKTFRPDVYSGSTGGVTQYEFPPAADYTTTLEGTGTWRTSYFEINDMKFAGVNQGPQAAARFTCNDKIPITRLQYAVIRPCGPTAGVNLLSGCKPVPVTLAAQRTGTQVAISWTTNLAGYTLQQNTVVTNTAGWGAVATAPVVENGNNVVKEAIGAASKFYRLTK
jgi:hypothetical protein